MEMTNEQKTTEGSVPVILQVVPYDDGLDEIRIYWEDFSSAKGQMTVTCYGQAWTTFFGAMWPGYTIQKFVCAVEADYLVNRMVDHTLPARKLKQQITYLTRIIAAVQSNLKEAPTC